MTASTQTTTPAVIRPTGTLGVIEARSLGAVLAARIAAGTPVVLDLADVIDMDLSALSSLIVARRAAHLAGVDMWVRGPVSLDVAYLIDDSLLGPFLGLDVNPSEMRPL